MNTHMILCFISNIKYCKLINSIPCNGQIYKDVNTVLWNEYLRKIQIATLRSDNPLFWQTTFERIQTTYHIFLLCAMLINYQCQKWKQYKANCILWWLVKLNGTLSHCAFLNGYKGQETNRGNEFLKI